MRELNRREAIRGAVYVGTGLALGSGLGALVDGCGRADPEPNERAGVDPEPDLMIDARRPEHYVYLEPAVNALPWLRGGHMITIDAETGEPTHWNTWMIEIPRPGARVNYRTFVLKTGNCEDGIVGHVLDCEVDEFFDYLFVKAREDDLVEGWENMPLWIHEDGTFA